MLRKAYKIIFVLCLLLPAALPVKAQYAVTGGDGTPLLAADGNRLQVYLVYGMADVRIQYTSSSTAHHWYRYKTNPLNDSEPVPSTQEGTSSFITGIEEGYGYYVAEVENVAMNNFVWIIDYSKYAFSINNVRVKETDAQCSILYFEGDINMPTLSYYLPTSQYGQPVMRSLEREIQLEYTTMDIPDGESRFVIVDSVQTITENPFGNFYIETPLADTEILFRGDQFARHFGVEKSASTEMFQTTRVAAGADTTFVSTDGTNVLAGTDGDSFSAPVEFRFYGYANEPVASQYKWEIRDEGGNTVSSFVGQEMAYTFLNKGTYTAVLTVTGRPGLAQCVDSAKQFVIKIRESDLQVPNVFTPGTSPGQNDVFKVAYKSLVSFKAWVFNRWGVEMYQWTDPAGGWDGKKGGKYCSPGAYYYIIEARGADGVKYKKTGHINLIRPKDVQDQITE